MAKRWASSRTRCSRNRASDPRGMRTGSERPGTKTSSKVLARAATGISSVSPSALEDPHAHAQLALAAVEQEELGRVGEALRPGRLSGVGVCASGVCPGSQQGGEPAGEDLLHGRVVVVAGDVADLEAPVLGRPGQAVLEHHHGPHVVRALEVAHVVALDPQRGAGQAERLLEGLQGPRPAVVVRGPPQAVPGQLLAGVAGHRLHQAALAAPLGHPQGHRRRRAGRPGRPL